MLTKILYSYIFILIIEVPIRSILFDSSIIRDIPLLILVAVWLLSKTRSGMSLKWSKMDLIVGSYVTYGLFLVVLNTLSGNTTLYEGMWNFRNFYFPMMLYYIAQSAFRDNKDYHSLVQYTGYMFFIISIEIIIEGVLKLYNMLTILPWYNYVFATNYRYIINSNNQVGYISTLDTPVLGILGWPHNTVLLLLVTFFISVLSNQSNTGDIKLREAAIKPHSKNRLIIIRYLLVIPALLILFVKAHMVSFVIIIIIYSIQFKMIKVFHIIISIIGTFMVYEFVPTLKFRLFHIIDILFIGSSNLPPQISRYFSISEIKNIFNGPIANVIFGEGNVHADAFSGNHAFEMRLVYFTYLFGLPWVVMFLMMIYNSFRESWYFSKMLRDNNYKMVAGALSVVMIIYSIEMLHYSYTMYSPHLYIIAVTMGIISSFKANHISME